MNDRSFLGGQSPDNKNKEKYPMLGSSNRVNTMSEGDWVGEVTDRILQAFPDKEIYTCAAGISPSGTVHFGNFRDVMTSLVFARELQRRGKKVRLLFSWDDFDRFRKVPANVDPSFSQYIGLPLTSVPDPTGKTESYARHWEKEFEEAMREVGIDLEYRYQTKEHQSGRYDDLIVKAMQSRTRIAEILLSFMSDKAKAEKQIDPEKFKKDYYPIEVYSRFTGKDNTRILDYDGQSTITYLCLDTNQQETINFHETHTVKLPWKVDWAMRWGAEGVVLEPGGHDHASPGGSYDTSSLIAKEVFGIQSPVFVGYQFIGIRGLKGKMSGSKGNAITPAQLLHIYEPEVLEWLYLRKNPHQVFDLAFDTEVYRQYDEFDRAMQEFLAEREKSAHVRSMSFLKDAEKPKYRKPMPFKQAVALGQILQWNIAKINALVEKMNLDYDPSSVAERVPKAQAWLREYNPEEMIALRDDVNTEYAASMSEAAKDLVHQLSSFLSEADMETLTVEKLEEVLYHIPKVEGLASAELKKSQRAFFKDLYRLLIGKNAGPRLATFVWAVGKERILKLLDI